MNKSQQLFTEALKVMPGGVNSPVRAFKSVGGHPLFIKKAKGAYIYDEDDRQFIDFVGSWGPMILGHNHPKVVEAIKNQADIGLSYGAPTHLEIQLVKKIRQFLPSMEMIRMVNSGTEATMSAIRLARGYTERNGILKFEGCYHGHSDALLVKSGSGSLTLGQPTSKGLPAESIMHTHVSEFNNIEALEDTFNNIGNNLACVIIEPIAGNMNCILPNISFLQKLRFLCDKYKVLLIFDEVMTGFRVGKNSAQGLYNIIPDLTTLGKIIGGGLPVGAFGGKTEIMQHLAPNGPVYQAGTLSGNPLAMVAGLSTLNLLESDNFYTNLSATTAKFTQGIQQLATENNIQLTTSAVGGMFGIFFTELQEVSSFKQVLSCNNDLYSKFFNLMLQEGIYFAPSAYEAGFISNAHSEKIIDKALEAVQRVFTQMNTF
jgi:glutamate-1-semialdehyde 2,1-aminomutase